MTSELLAELIAQGGNDELLPLLWEKMRKLFRQKSITFFQRHSERCSRAGVSLDDLLSESYLAMLDAVKAYGIRNEENSTLSFSTFCNFPFTNRANQLAGLRTKRQLNEPLNNAVSLDIPLIADNECNFRSIDFIPDPQAQADFEKVDETIEAEQIAAAVRREIMQRLTEQQRDIITRRYWKKQTLREIGEALGITRERVRQIECNAFSELRKSKELRELYEVNYYIPCSARSCLAHGSSVEITAERREKLYEKLQEREQALYNRLFEYNPELAERYAAWRCF